MARNLARPCVAFGSRLHSTWQRLPWTHRGLGVLGSAAPLFLPQSQAIRQDSARSLPDTYWQKDEQHRVPLRRVLVTGGAGFLGSHLCQRLLADGHEVLCLDNFFISERRNIACLQLNKDFEFVRHDVTREFVCECDWIFNLACPPSPAHYQYNPIKTLKVSVLGTLNMLGLAKRTKARLLQASTSEVYGDPELSPQPETYWGNVSCTGCRSCYDEGKRAAETLCFDYMRTNQVEVRVARIFNTYGPGMHPYDGRVVSNFILQALRDEDITVYGTGHQTRSFCYVDDLIEGLVRLMEQDVHSGPINIGNPQQCTIPRARDAHHRTLWE